ncbi:MAG: o-succinylbenzoate synthase [Desulfurococcales archaeon]|nr:o-succinylbenzoate synthase [Desulfurococcales archaeon]
MSSRSLVFPEGGVSRIVLYEVWMELVRPFRTSFGSTSVRPALLVRVIGDDGFEGWGEVVAGEGPWYSYETYETAFHVIRDYILPLAGKRRAFTPDAFSEAVRGIRGHNMAKAGVEEALWDLAARRAGVPLWRFIGGVRDRIESGVSIGIQPSIDDLLGIVGDMLDQGYKRIKIKIEPGWDVEPVKAIRREFGDIPLQVDANAAYTLGSMQVFRELDDMDLIMIEQPLHYDDLLDHAYLARRLRTPICLDESIHSPRRAREALQLDSAGIVNIKPGRVGGVGPSLEIHDLWSMEAGRPVWIGGMLETGIGRGILVALATLPGVAYPNDISASSRYYKRDIVEPEWRLENGYIKAPERPGIGVEPLIDEIEKLSRRVYEYRIS